MTAPTAVCTVCGSPFTPRRSTARYCRDACRKSAQRGRDRGLPIEAPVEAAGAHADAFLSVTGQPTTPHSTSGADVTLTPQQSRPPKPLPKGIVRDAKFPTMYRLVLPDGTLSDMVNLTRARDALAAIRDDGAP
jgi:hypothetical protein